MIEPQLFLGIPVDSYIRARLSSSKSYSWFFSPNSNYLIEVGVNGKFYIGKTLDQAIESETLINTQAYIYSLLSKLDPDFSFKSIPLVLFPYHD